MDLAYTCTFLPLLPAGCRFFMRRATPRLNAFYAGYLRSGGNRVQTRLPFAVCVSTRRAGCANTRCVTQRACAHLPVKSYAVRVAFVFLVYFTSYHTYLVIWYSFHMRLLRSRIFWTRSSSRHARIFYACGTHAALWTPRVSRLPLTFYHHLPFVPTRRCLYGIPSPCDVHTRATRIDTAFC